MNVGKNGDISWEKLLNSEITEKTEKRLFGLLKGKTVLHIDAKQYPDLEKFQKIIEEKLPSLLQSPKDIEKDDLAVLRKLSRLECLKKDLHEKITHCLNKNLEHELVITSQNIPNQNLETENQKVLSEFSTPSTFREALETKKAYLQTAQRKFEEALSKHEFDEDSQLEKNKNELTGQKEKFDNALTQFDHFVKEYQRDFNRKNQLLEDQLEKTESTLMGEKVDEKYENRFLEQKKQIEKTINQLQSEQKELANRDFLSTTCEKLALSAFSDLRTENMGPQSPLEKQLMDLRTKREELKTKQTDLLEKADDYAKSKKELSVLKETIETTDRHISSMPKKPSKLYAQLLENKLKQLQVIKEELSQKMEILKIKLEVIPLDISKKYEIFHQESLGFIKESKDLASNRLDSFVEKKLRDLKFLSKSLNHSSLGELQGQVITELWEQVKEFDIDSAFSEDPIFKQALQKLRALD